MVEAVVLARVRDVKVRSAITVVIAPGRSFGPTLVDHARRDGDVAERAVPIVTVEPASIARIRVLAMGAGDV